MSKKEKEYSLDPEEEEENGEEENEEAQKEIEKAVESLAKKVETRLNLEGLQKKIDKIISKDGPDTRNVVSKIFTSGDVKRGVDSLTKEEKIVGFFQGLVHNDQVVLHALAEGVAADLKNPQVCLGV